MPDAKKITTLLLKKYPNPGIALNFSNPLELLVATILSAQCTDVRVNEVTKTLFKKYKNVKNYAAADLKAFENEIRPAGFYRNKAKMIIGCCQKLIKEFNGRVPSTIEELTTLPGVGRKTANVILGSAFGKQAIAVDTHVHKISNLLGWVKTKTPQQTEKELVKIIPKKYWSDMNRLFVCIGRQFNSKRKLEEFLRKNGLIA